MGIGRDNYPPKKEYKIVVYDTLEKKVWVDTKENVESEQTLCFDCVKLRSWNRSRKIRQSPDQRH